MQRHTPPLTRKTIMQRFQLHGPNTILGDEDATGILELKKKSTEAANEELMEPIPTVAHLGGGEA